MIQEHCFTKEWLESFKRQKAYARIDKIILEKMIYALHLLESLQTHGLNFVFKGGTSLALLLEQGSRFSIDIDIICPASREEVESVLHKVVANSRFKQFEIDEYRSYKEGVPKAHYGFMFDSAIHPTYSGKILLDILIGDSIYPEHVQRSVNALWIETHGVTQVRLPSVDSITGDKLTAFAPNTIGIPYVKNGQSFSMEICKQLFDLSKLFEQIQNMQTVADSFYGFAVQEAEYRKGETEGKAITPKMALLDTIDTCLIIAKRGNGSPDEKEKFDALGAGIKSFGNAFLIEGRFRIDEAISAAARVALLAAKIRADDVSPLQRYADQDIRELTIDAPEWSFLNRLKKLPDTSAFFYWYQAVPLLAGIDRQ